MRKSVEYINNRTLYTHMIEHKTKMQNAEREEKELPRASQYIGEAILKICNKLSTKSCFANYSFRMDMVSDGILDCTAAINNFNPDKTTNPFAYFTQIAWNAFLRRIEKEKKQIYIKHKNYQNHYYIEDTWYEQNNNDERSNDIIRNFEEKNKQLTKKKKPTKIKGIERFQVEEESNEK